MRTPLRLSVPLARVRGGTGYSFELTIVADEAIRPRFFNVYYCESRAGCDPARSTARWKLTNLLSAMSTQQASTRLPVIDVEAFLSGEKGALEVTAKDLQGALEDV